VGNKTREIIGPASWPDGVDIEDSAHVAIPHVDLAFVKISMGGFVPCRHI
jgi:hypothetical protein